MKTIQQTFRRVNLSQEDRRSLYAAGPKWATFRARQPKPLGPGEFKVFPGSKDVLGQILRQSQRRFRKRDIRLHSTAPSAAPVAFQREERAKLKEFARANTSFDRKFGSVAFRRAERELEKAFKASELNSVERKFGSVEFRRNERDKELAFKRDNPSSDRKFGSFEFRRKERESREAFARAHPRLAEKFGSQDFNTKQRNIDREFRQARLTTLNGELPSASQTNRYNQAKSLLRGSKGGPLVRHEIARAAALGQSNSLPFFGDTKKGIEKFNKFAAFVGAPVRRRFFSKF